MKKYISILLLIVLIVPSIAFASWWNPFSWNVWNQLFHNKEVTQQTQVMNEPTIIESDNNLITTIPTTNEVKKDVPVIDNSVTQKKESQAKLEAELRAKAEQEAFIIKQKAEEQVKIEAEQKLKAEQDALLIKQNTEVQAKQESIITEVDIKGVECSWGGSDDVYILKFSINGSWSGGNISIKTDYQAPPFTGTTSGVHIDPRVLRRGGLLYKSDIARDGGFRIGSKSGLSKSLSDNFSYDIQLYSEGPYYRQVGTNVAPFFPASSLLLKKSGTFTIPDCQ